MNWIKDWFKKVPPRVIQIGTVAWGVIFLAVFFILLQEPSFPERPAFIVLEKIIQGIFFIALSPLFFLLFVIGLIFPGGGVGHGVPPPILLFAYSFVFISVLVEGVVISFLIYRIYLYCVKLTSKQRKIAHSIMIILALLLVGTVVFLEAKYGREQSAAAERKIILLDEDIASLAYNNSVSVCETLPSNPTNRKRCYKEFASKESDYVLCEKTEELNYSCIQNIATKNDDVSKCSTIGTYADSCYYLIAKQTNNSALCEHTSTSKALCYHDVAITTMNDSLCENTHTFNASCYYGVAIATMDSTLCEKTSSSNSSCYFNIAVGTKSHDLCKLSGGNRLRCLALTGSTNDVMNYCNTESEEWRTLKCLADYGVIRNDTGLCDIAGEQRFQPLCYYQLALKTNNTKYCENAKQFKNACYKLEPYS